MASHLWRLPSSGRGLKVWIRASKERQPTRAFAFDQRLERYVDQARLLLEPHLVLGLAHELVVERDRRAHPSTSSIGADIIVV